MNSTSFVIAGGSEERRQVTVAVIGAPSSRSAAAIHIDVDVFE